MSPAYKESNGKRTAYRRSDLNPSFGGTSIKPEAIIFNPSIHNRSANLVHTFKKYAL